MQRWRTVQVHSVEHFIKETSQTVSNESLMDGAEHRQNFNEILPVMAVTKFN